MFYKPTLCWLIFARLINKLTKDMALDPLKFAVQITDEATSKLTTIKTELDKLQNKDIAINVSGNLGDFLNLFKEGVDASKFSNLKDAISNALSGVEGLNKAAKEGNFADYAAQIKTASDAVTALGTAISAVNNVVGTNEGFQKFMVSIGEVVTRVDAALKQLNETTTSGANASSSKSIEKAKYELYQFDNLVKQAEQTSRLGKQFGDVDTTGLDKAIEKLQTYRAELKQITISGKSENGRGFDKFAMQAEYKEAVDQVKKLSAEQHSTEMNLGRYNAMLKETDALWDRIIAAWKQGSNLGVATANMQPAERQAHDFYARLKSLNEADLNNVQIIAQLAAEFQRLKGTLTATAKEQEKLNAATEKQKSKDAADAAKKSQKENEAWAKSMRDASAEANKLGIELDKLRKTEKDGSAVGVDTTKLKSYIQELEAYKKILDKIADRNRTFGHTSEWMSGSREIGNDTLGNTTRLANAAASAVRELTAEKQRAKSSTSQLTNEEQRLAQALNQTAESAKGQSQVLSDLKSMAMQYLGVWGGQQFLHNIIEIGGQLEMQRLSIGAILQNQGQANELFEKIKGLAIQSPFGVVELDQMTKQLTAYGFKYSELFDMTKRLADISAATGTGVDRLALALGHVRSEAALSGYTLRQFSMGNVPLLQKLSEKLGKTTQEIRKMVRSKEISYEDVEGVIKDLTNEGGMFYNMQETISQSVKARFKNVKDAMDIMYGEMAEGGLGSVLKDIALLLMKLTKNWKTVGAAITGAVAPMVLYKVAMLATAKAISANNVATGQFTAKQLEAQVVSGNLTKKMLLQAVASGRLSVADAQAAAARLGLTKAQLQFVAKSGSVAAATNKATLATSRYTVAQLRSLAVARDNSYSLLVRGLARLKFGFGVASGAAKAFGATLAGLMRSFLPLAAMSAVFAIISRSVEASSKAQEMAKDIAENARDTQKAINTVIQEQADDSLLKSIEKSKLSVNGRYVVQNAIEFNDDALNKTNLTEKIKSLREELQNLSPLFSGDIIDINEAESQVEQYKILVNKLESLRHVNDVNEATANVLPNANKRVQGGNWFTRMLGDSFTTDLTDYSNRMEDSVEEINQISEVELDKIDKALNGKLTQLQKDLDLSSLGEALKLYFLNGKRELESGSTDFNAELYKIINGTGEKQTLKDYYDSFFDPVTFGRSLHSQRSQLLGETKKIAQAITSTINTYFKDDPEGAVYALKGFFDKMFAEAGVTDNSVMQETINKVLDDMRDILGKSGQEIVDEFQRKQVMIQFSNIISPDAIENAKSKKELDALFQDYLRKVQEWARIFGIDLEKLGLASGGKYFGGFRKAFEAAKNTESMLKDWQKRAKKAFEVNTEIKVKTTTITDMEEFVKTVREDLAKKKAFVKDMDTHIHKTFNIDFGIKFTAESIGKMIAKISDQILKMPQGELQNKLWSQLFDELMPFYDALRGIEEDQKWLKSEGFAEKDPTKDKSKNKKDTKKSYKDPDVERWRERLKNLKAAYDEYKKLEEEFGSDEALERVKKQFKGLIDEKDIENIEKYKEQVIELKEKALNRYLSQKKDKSKDYGKQAQQLVRESEKAITDYDITEQKRKSDEYMSKLKLQLDELKKQWETFNKVRAATGNEEIAAHVAGLSQDQASKRDIANSVKANIQGIIQEMGGEVKVPIKFDVTSSDKDIENNVKAALGGSEKYREQIKGIVEAIKTWRDLERDSMQKSVDAYTQAISKAMDYESQVSRINAELEEQNRLVEQNNNLSQEQKDRAKDINQANASMKMLEASDSYKRFFNGIFGETKTELQGMANIIKAQLNYSLEKGAITAEDYAKKIKDIDDVLKNSVVNDTDAWYNSGIFDTRNMDKRLQDRYDKGFETYQQGANQYQMGLSIGDDAMQKAGEEMMKNGKSMMAGAQKASIALAIIDKVVHGINQSIQGTVKAFDYLKEALDALGVESDTMSTVGDYLHTLGEMSSHVTQSWDNFKSGNFVGAGVEAIGAVTSVIKGFSQAHDNRLERAIERLRDDVQSIEANTELIAKARERTLGYDMGDVRKQMAQQYAPSQQASGLPAYIAMLLSGGGQKKSMYDFYTQNSQGTGYQQEYDNLVEQREKYLEILKDQQSKKKKSNDEIEETKAKIAELDDQIAYFTQDLAKELWSIDIKGWADQLSDALASAFENGENMAKAYRDTVTQIIQQMMQKMMQLAILEPMFERLQKQLFGENGKGGVFDPNNPRGSMSKVTAMIADFFGKGGEGEKAITASMEFMTAFQRGMQNAGLTVLNEASNTLSSSIQGTTEETSGLLAGYVNALRQDVSVNRILLTQFVSQMWPDYMDVFASQVTAVQNIDNNVQVIMTMMQMGSGAMYNEIAALRSRIDNVVLGIDKFSIR